jgi:hypothetical protein
MGIIVVLTTTGGCIPITIEPGPSPLQAELDANRAKWAAMGLDDYEYNLFTGCSCPDRIVGPNIMTVSDGVVTGIRSAADGTPIELEEGFFYPTIDDLFDRIQRAFDGEVRGNAFSAQYDDEFGYPTSIYIDWVPEYADEESSYYARDLVIP